MFCREQVAQFLEVAEDIESRGAGLVLASTGNPHFAKTFREDRNVTVPLVVDPSGAIYEAAQWRTSLGSTVSLATMKNARRATAAGFRQGRTRGLPFQQGGVLVVQPDHTIGFRYESEVAGDHPAIADVLAAL